MKDFIPEIQQVKDVTEVSAMNPIVLAFVGDAVHTLFTRTELVSFSDAKAGELHKLCSDKVKAASQARAADALMETFTEDEAAIFRRARNAKNNTVPKNADRTDYRKATGFEAVLGYLYLTGRHDRIRIIMEKAGL